MGNFIDYLDWRGDLAFKIMPYNDVDGLLLSYLSYIDLKSIVPEVGKGEISLKEAADKYFQKWDLVDIEKDKSFVRLSPLILKKMAETKRFRNAKLKSYVEVLTDETQFSALEIITGDGVHFISYSGTDNSITGWEEDFRFSYCYPECDSLGVKYLNDVATKGRFEIRVGGHSKGGHLALYSSIFCNKKIRKRITEIHMFDGPGFYNKDLFSEPGYLEIKERVKRTVPQGSVIGMLLNYDMKPTKYVKSVETGIYQHDGFSWQVVSDDFEKCEKMSKPAKMFDDKINEWINDISLEERKVMTKEIYEALKNAGIDQASELLAADITKIVGILLGFSKSSKTSRKNIEKLIGIIISLWPQMIRAGRDEKNETKIIQKTIEAKLLKELYYKK